MFTFVTPAWHVKPFRTAALNRLAIKLPRENMQWFFRPDLLYVMGSDLAGTVARIAAEVTQPAPGRPGGWAPCTRGLGAFAE